MSILFGAYLFGRNERSTYRLAYVGRRSDRLAGKLPDIHARIDHAAMRGGD